MIKSLSQPGINCKSLCLFLSDTTTDADSSILLKNSNEHVNDLGLYYTKAQSLCDDRKLELLKNSWTPARAYNFPKTQFYGKNRAFCFEWLSFRGSSTLRLRMERFAAFVFYLDT